MPIASPIRNRRLLGFITPARTGDAGCSSSAEKAQAEIMNVPRQIPSIMYSGQCVVNARFASFAQCPVLSLAATGSSSSCAAKIVTAVAGVLWGSLLMRAGIRNLGKCFTAEKQNHAPPSLFAVSVPVRSVGIREVELSTECQQSKPYQA